MKPQPTRKTWAVVRHNNKFEPRSGYVPCLFGRRRDAIENCDTDEIVVQVEFRILKRYQP